jgi:prepilin signal peptidase PulO-like enzyme (type II secretory pathway)
MLLPSLILFFLGTCFGSFINALTWRIHEKKDWVKERSQCPNCDHTLAAHDLVPIISWLTLRGRCRYCGHSISPQYPIVEFATGLAFTGSYIFWPGDLADNGQKVLFATWLASLVGLIALLIYDLKWMLLPNKLIYPTLAVAAAGQLAYLLFYAADRPVFIVNWFFSVIIASGLFFVLFIISGGRWIGFGDVRLGLITGTLLHFPSKSLLMIFLSSFIGLLFVLPSLFSRRRALTARIPYGPFLIISTIICLLFGSSLINWYSDIFL